MYFRCGLSRANRLFAAVSFGALTLTGVSSTVLADTIWLRSGSGTPLPLPNIHVQKVEGDSLVYVSESSGNEAHKPLESISRIKLDDDAPFSTAEETYAGGDAKGSIDGYRKALQSSARPWVKQRSATRLIDAGVKAGDISTSVAGYTALVTLDPDAAGKLSIVVPAGATSDSLAQSIKTVKAATSGSVPPAQKDLLLNLLARLQTANKDAAGATDTLKTLGKSEDAGSPAGGDAAPAGGAGNRVRGDAKVSEAKLALAKNPKQAIETITSNSALITEPDQQDEALYTIAEAKYAIAGSDSSALTDAAIAYMRVVANFKNLQGAPHVADSLLKTAQIEEKLGKTAEAAKAYQDVVEQYKGTPAAKTAADSAARLGKGK